MYCTIMNNTSAIYNRANIYFPCSAEINFCIYLVEWDTAILIYVRDFQQSASKTLNLVQITLPGQYRMIFPSRKCTDIARNIDIRRAIVALCFFILDYTKQKYDFRHESLQDKFCYCDATIALSICMG